MNDTNERSVASRGSRSIREHFRISVQAGLFNSLKSIHAANVLLETVILPAFDEVPTLTDEEREAVETAVGFCECTTSPLPTSDQIATLRSLLSRIGDCPEPENATNEDKVLTAAERLVLRQVCEEYANEDDVRRNEIAYVIDRILARMGK